MSRKTVQGEKGSTLRAGPTKTHTSVSIVGFAPTCNQTPFHRQDMHFWGMNDLWKALPQGRWHAWFDLHHKHVQKSNPRTKEEHYKWLQSLNIPAFMLEKDTDVPTSVEFPLQTVSDMCIDKEPYFTSGPSYMFAFAIHLGYQEIHLYGINLLGDEEYAYQRPCFEFWAGVAHGKGIKIVNPRESTILRSNFRYGYDTHGHENLPIVKHLKMKLLEHQQKSKQAEAALHTLHGANEALTYAVNMIEHDARGGVMPDREKPMPVLPNPAKLFKGPHERVESEVSQSPVQAESSKQHSPDHEAREG